MLAEVTDPDAVIEQGTRRRRHENLSTVAGGHDTRRVVDVETNVASGDQAWLTRVQADSHANLVPAGPLGLGQRALGIGRRGGSIVRGCKGDEERVALAIENESTP